MKNYSLLLLLFCCTLFMNACSDDDDVDAALSREEMLQGKRWQITALAATTPLSLDFYAQLNACQRDNYLEFRDNGILVMDEGASKCQTSSPQQVQGTWTLNGDVLTLQGLGAALGLPVPTLAVTITDLSNTSLTASFNQSIPFQGVPIPVTGTVTMRAL